MKIRTDFVTNSSSSSYVTVLFIKKTGEEIELTSAIDDNGFNEALALKFQDELDELVKTADSGESLMQMLDDLYDGMLLECVDCGKIIVDAIQGVKSFDELKEIVLMDKYSDGESDDIKMTYRYNVNSGNSQMTVEEKEEDKSEDYDGE